MGYSLEATTWLARPSPGPRRLSSVSLHSLSTGCSSVAARASSTFGRARRPRVANTPRTSQRLSVRCSPPPSLRRVRTVPAAAFSAFAVSHRGHAHRLAQGHPRPLPRGRAARPLRASRGVEDWLARRLRDVLRIIHGLPTGCLRDARLATSPRVPRHPRSRLSWPTAPPPRRLARALAGPSPAPSPNPRTVRLSASRLPSLTARRGSNLPSRAVGSC